MSDAAPADEATTEEAGPSKALSGIIGGGKGGGTKPVKAPAKKATAKAAPAKEKAAPKAKAKEKEADGDKPKIVRSASTVSKEGTMVDIVDGQEYPVTAFPTYKDKDGNVQRRPYTRKNEKVYRDNRKKEREAQKTTEARLKEEAKAAKAAANSQPSEAPAE